MQNAVLIQKSIQRQATARVRLPSPIAQFRTFLNRGAKPSPEDKTEPPPPPKEEEKGETPPPPENGGGGGIDWEGGEPTGEPADAGAAQDASKTPQGASAEGEGKPLPQTQGTPQGAENAPLGRGGEERKAHRREKRGA